MTDGLISKREAIEAIYRCHVHGNGLKRFTERLGHTDAFSEGILDAVNAVEDLPTVHDWIPVTDHLPEQFGRYLVTFVPDAGNLWTCVDFAMYSDIMGIAKKPLFWQGNVGKPDFVDATKYVTAWMPLPEPWKGEV